MAPQNDSDTSKRSSSSSSLSDSSLIRRKCAICGDQNNQLQQPEAKLTPLVKVMCPKWKDNRSVLCNFCINRVVIKLAKNEQATSTTSTNRTNQTDAFVFSSQSQSQQSQPSVPPPAALQRIPPMPRSVKEAFMRKNTDLPQIDSISVSTGNLSDIADDVEDRNAEASLNLSKRKSLEPEGSANKRKKNNTDANRSASSSDDNPASRNSSADSIDQRINNYTRLYVPTPAGQTNGSLNLRPIVVATPSVAKSPVVPASNSDRQQPPVSGSSAPPRATPQSPIAGPSGIQTQRNPVPPRPAIVYDTSSESIDPDDLVPDHLRVKPSQVPRMRVPPPTRAIDPKDMTSVPKDVYARPFGG